MDKLRDEYEIIIDLPWGGTLRCGQGEEHAYGGYVRVCDKQGNETNCWDKEEWKTDPELVMGAIFLCAAELE